MDYRAKTVIGQEGIEGAHFEKLYKKESNAGALLKAEEDHWPNDIEHVVFLSSN